MTTLGTFSMTYGTISARVSRPPCPSAVFGPVRMNRFGKSGAVIPR